MQKIMLPVLFFSLSLFVTSFSRADDEYDLERIINRALEASWGMLDARDDIQRAGLRLNTARSEFELKIYPGASVDFTGGEGLDSAKTFGLSVSLEKKVPFGTQIALTPSAQKSDDQYQNQVNLRITQPLLRGAGREYNLSGVYSARFSERTAERSGYLKAVDTVINAVRNGYEVIRQGEILRLREESFQRLKDLEEATAIKERMGLVTAMDLYRVRIERNQAEEELNQSRQSHVDALDTLKIFLALPLKADVNVTLPLDFDRIYPDEEAMIQAALANRVELEQVRDELAEARRLSDIAGKNTLPELDIGLSVNFTGDPASRFSDSKPDETTWGVSLGSTTDLWRTTEKAAFEESLINVQQTVRRQRILKDEIIAGVKRELRNLERQDKAITTQEDQINQARGQLELARVKFQHGMTDNFDLIDAEIALRRAETQLISAVIEYIVGQYRLRRAVGSLIKQTGEDVSGPGQQTPDPAPESR